jgi:hypothetical protein
MSHALPLKLDAETSWDVVLATARGIAELKSAVTTL